MEILINLIAGAVGGNAAGASLKNFSLGTIGNSIAGIIGGGLGGQLLGSLGILGGGDADSSLEMGNIASNVLGSGAGGGILMVIVGFIKNKMAG